MADSKFVFLGVALVLATLDALSTWLLVLYYTSPIDVMSMVNYNFMAMTLVLLLFSLRHSRQILGTIRKAGDISLLVWLLSTAVVLGLVNLAMGYINGAQLGIRFALTHFYGLGMPILCLAFASQFGRTDVERVSAHMVRYAWCYTVIGFSGILVYLVLYYSGHILYFGMGTNAHYVLPWLIASKGPVVLLPVGLLILISGKRAVLLNYIVQSVVYFSKDAFRRPLFAAALGVGAMVLAFFLVQYTNLLERFVWSFMAMYNLSDPTWLLIAFGGRGEEVAGILNYFAEHPIQILFGAPPGESYHWIIESSNTDEVKNYAHVTPFGLIFRYGIIVTTALYGLLAYFLVKYFAPKDPYYLAFVGIVTSTAFGANMIVDPTTWLLLGLMLRLSQKAEPTSARG